MNDNRLKIGYFEFKRICKVKKARDFGGFRIERDGVYLNRLDEATLRLLSEEEKKAVQGWHPTGRHHEPALPFPCDVDELLKFVNESGLAGCIHGPSLSDWLQLATPVSDTREPDKAPQAVENKGEEQTDTAPSGATEKAAPAGVPKREILAIDWPLHGKFNQESLSAALSDVPDWLKPARTARGSPGVASARWNPAKVADCLVRQGHANQKAAVSFIGKYFAEWLPEWEKFQEYG